MSACSSLNDGSGVGDGVGDGVLVGIGVLVGSAVGAGVDLSAFLVGVGVGNCTVCCAGFAVSKETKARPSTIIDETMYNKDFNLFIFIGISINIGLVDLKNNSSSLKLKELDVADWN